MHSRISAAEKLSSQEFALAAACCRWQPLHERSTAIRGAAKRVTDWGRFFSIVINHRVAMLVREALRVATVPLPSSIEHDLDFLTQRDVRSALKLAAETVRLQMLLTAAGIPCVVLKGVALEQLAYGAIATKQTRDIDLLVPPECAETTLQLLEEDGYTLSLPARRLNTMQRRALLRHGGEVELIELRRNVRVEVQWRTADNRALLSGIDAYAPTQTVTLSPGVSVRTLAPDDLFAYLCVHGARHSWCRLKWLADLNALMVSSKADIEPLYRTRAKDRRRGAAQGLLLCQRLLGLKLPPGLVEELEANKRHQKLVAIAIEAMQTPDSGGDRGICAVGRELRNQFLLGKGLRFYAAQCRLALVGIADIVRLPLPRPLHFIYPLVRVPLWVWRRAKMALAPL